MQPHDDVLQAVHEGAISNALLVSGTFALLAAMADPDAIVRDGDSPWIARHQ